MRGKDGMNNMMKVSAMMNDKIVEFESFGKISRFSREIVITEKIDGTNAQIYITEDNEIFAGSRNRWITVENDNYGFARWVESNKEDLLKLGYGRHFGEWWGSGIQRGYDLPKGEKRFSLFNVSKWNKDNIPACCHVVPILATGIMGEIKIDELMESLKQSGSIASPGFMRPEGIVIYHKAANVFFKKTFDKDSEGKDWNKQC